MKNKTKLWLPIVLAAVALTASACGGNSGGSGNDSGGMSGMSDSEMSAMEDTSQSTGASEMSGMQGMEETTDMSETSGMQSMDMGSMLMDENGEYSDELFIDEMVPHHQAAIEEARVALDNTDRPELRNLAENIVSSQEREIEELRQIKQQEFGSSEVPSGMSDEEMQMMGMSMTPEELANARPFDKAFLKNMIPHHQSAIDMAQVALDNSENEDIRRIAQEIITAQEREIEQMRQWQQEWYPNS